MTKPNTRQLLEETLTAIGAEYHVAEHMKGTPYIAKYREETFIFYADDSNLKVVIWDYYWYSVSAFDIEKINELKIAINEVNKRAASKLVCKADDEDKIGVSSKRVIIISREMTGLAKYLQLELNGMLSLHSELYQALTANKSEKEKEVNNG